MKNPNIKVLKVRVTRKDIVRGRPCNPGYCPIAIAGKRATKGEAVRVEAFVRFFVKKSPLSITAWTAPLTKKARRFIKKFDTKQSVKPQCFRFVFRSTEL